MLQNMITPRFNAKQNDDFIILTVKAPYVKFSEGEMVLNGHEFTFYCKPYFLKLYFSDEITENGLEHASYSIDDQEFTIKLPKLHQGEHFENLDMLTTLMAPKQLKSCQSQIEVLDSTDACSSVTGDVRDSNKDPVPEDYVATQFNEVKNSNTASNFFIVSCPHYGFNNKASGLFDERQEESWELIDIPDPDHTPASERRELQFNLESSQFSSDHYLADLVEDEIIEILIKEPLRCFCGEPTESDTSFTEPEQEALLSLPKKEYLLDAEEKTLAFHGLVDILYAYLYELRTTCGEWSVESPWTIRKLSSLLSCLNTADNLLPTLISCVRRSLCYPLYRHWSLSMKVVEDVAAILSSGRVAVLKALLQIRSLFNDEAKLSSIANCIEASVRISKGDAMLQLDAVEKQLLEDCTENGSSCSHSSTAESDISLDSDDDSVTSDSQCSYDDSLQDNWLLGGDNNGDVLTELSNMTLNDSVIR